MVTVLVQRQQREAAQRRERLHAARQAAAALSVQQARSYRAQKHKQTEDVRNDALQRWQEAQSAEMAALDALVRRGAAQQNDGNEAAAQHEADAQRTACTEAAAWRSEHTLEAARHRLAVAYTRTEAHVRQRPQMVAQQRREAVRSAEKARAARVAASPAVVPSAADVMRGLHAAPVATDVRAASIPVSSPVADSVRDAGEREREESATAGRTSLVPRRWRMSSVAPHAKVTVHTARSHSPTVHSGEESDADGVTDVQRATQAYAEHCAAQHAAQEQVRVDGQQRAAQRAAAALRQQHEAQAEVEGAERNQRERRAAVRELYRNPREETVEVPAEKEDGAQPASPSPPLQPAPLRGLTRQQQAQCVYREGEAGFRATFVEGPPVAVAAVPPSPRTASLEALLRPADVADLLYTTSDAPAVRQREEGRQAVAVEETWQSRVLPSAPLRMLSLHRAAAPSTAAPPSQAAQPPSPPASPLPQENRAASPIRPMAAPVPAAPAPPAALANAAPQRAAELTEEIDMSPLKPPSTVVTDKSAGMAIEPPSSAPPSKQQPVLMSPVAAPTHAAAVKVSSPPRAAVAAVSQPSSVLLSAATTPMRTPARRQHDGGNVSPSTTASSASSPSSASTGSRITEGSPAVHSSEASSLMESSGFSGTTASSSTRHPLPTMTAEQLKLALLRLRSRIATAPM